MPDSHASPLQLAPRPCYRCPCVGGAGHAGLDAHLCPDAAQASVELQTFYRQAHFPGQGVGHTLFKQAEDMAQALAQSALWLTVNVQNQRATDFYIAHGYRKHGVHMFMLGGIGHQNQVMVGSD